MASDRPEDANEKNENIEKPAKRKRAPRSENRADAILDAASDVFIKKGYQRATTKEIAKAAGLAEGTIFNYFPNKRALFVAVVQRTVTETLPGLFAQPSPNNEEFLGALIRDRFALFERFQPLIPLVVQELAIDEELRREFLERFVVPMVDQIGFMISQRLQTGSMRQISPRVILPGAAGAVALTLLATQLFQAYEVKNFGPPLSHEEMIAQLLDLILHGISNQPGPSITSSDAS